MDEHLFGTVSPDTAGFKSYWENFYHHADDESRLSDTLRTYFASFSRLATRHISWSYCKNLPIGKYKEITYLNEDDEFSGMLILQDVGLKGGKSITTETWLSRIDQEQMMNLNMSNGPNRLTGLQVSLMQVGAELEKSKISGS